MGPAPLPREARLDLIRGVAVLGILAINLGGYAGPIAGTLSPHVPNPGSPADELWFAAGLLVFEGKMRALFTLLFGASLVLYIDRAEARGADGEQLQFRRLGWLAVFGYLHYLLFWWGDILFTYAVAGFAALALRRLPPAWLLASGVVLFASWHGAVALDGLPRVAVEARVLAGTASPAEAAAYRTEQQRDTAATGSELAGYRQGFGAQIVARLRENPFEPLSAALSTIGESLPLMLIGMALYRTGFFSGQWSRRSLLILMIAGAGSGGIATALFVRHALAVHFPPVLMIQGLAYWLALPHLAMAVGYAALLGLVAPRLLRTAPGRRLAAAGQMALSNYLGMTLVMTALFYGWGLGLVGTVPEHRLWPFLLGGWAAMLGWSAPWLARFRHGPLEWAWRSLTLGERVPFRR